MKDGRAALVGAREAYRRGCDSPSASGSTTTGAGAAWTRRGAREELLLARALGPPRGPRPRAERRVRVDLHRGSAWWGPEPRSTRSPRRTGGDRRPRSSYRLCEYSVSCDPGHASATLSRLAYVRSRGPHSPRVGRLAQGCIPTYNAEAQPDIEPHEAHMPRDKPSRRCLSFPSPASLLAQPALAQIVPPDRATTWNPGIPGGIPARTTVCATVAAGGNIQAAINACPAGRWCSSEREPGTSRATLRSRRPSRLRGAGSRAHEAHRSDREQRHHHRRQVVPEASPRPTNLAANALKGGKHRRPGRHPWLHASGRSWSSTRSPTRASPKWGYSNCQSVIDDCRLWFTRPNRPIGQVLEVAAVSGNTVTFVTPLHIDFKTANAAQLSRISLTAGAPSVP